jgi:hypothetical protein
MSVHALCVNGEQRFILRWAPEFSQLEDAATGEVVLTFYRRIQSFNVFVEVVDDSGKIGDMHLEGKKWVYYESPNCSRHDTLCARLAAAELCVSQRYIQTRATPVTSQQSVLEPLFSI